jgi:hypothetical protein
MEVRHGNGIDCPFGVVFAGWWRLGIFSLARIAPNGASQNGPDKNLTVGSNVDPPIITE